jgi:L-aminoadipate-semialdehyde dehydrogenase
VTTELDVRVEVPALELLPDGSVVGGSNESIGDVLELTRELADTDPGIVLGPDSVGTLSFTSGSTGIPKGVKGRHYSLTHFFPWMGERFGLSEDSRFTMLSGIAHDPIQRDSMLNWPFSLRIRLTLYSVHAALFWSTVTRSNS